MKRTAYGSYVVGRFEVFAWVGFWRWGSYGIGESRVLQVGPARVFVRPRSTGANPDGKNP